MADQSSSIYEPEVQKFLEWLCGRGETVLSLRDFDRLLAKRLDVLCYKDQVGPHRGANLFYGLLHFFPELGGHLPRSSRALKAWGKIIPGNEGGPIPREAIWHRVIKFFEAGKAREGVALAVAFDGYLRSQDLRQVLAMDAFFDGHSVALTFGISSRGSSSKAGLNHGVVVRRGWIAEMVLGLKKKTSPADPLFPFTSEKLRCLWQKGWAEEGLSFVKALHELRHSGAASDIAEGVRELR